MRKNQKKKANPLKTFNTVDQLLEYVRKRPELKTCINYYDPLKGWVLNTVIHRKELA